MPLVVGGDESDRCPPQDRPGDERTLSAPSRLSHHAVFAREVDAGNVWVSALGVGAGSAEVRVNSPDWLGGPELARELFYGYLETGRYVVDRARVVRRTASGSPR
jgi:hypothetical protein